jgi:hypothetical protein
MFHRYVARLLFFSKRPEINILLAISVLAGRVQDLGHLERVYRYLNHGTRDNFEFCVYIDASISVMMTLGAALGWFCNYAVPWLAPGLESRIRTTNRPRSLSLLSTQT